MTCCNHNCRQGRDCPNRPQRTFLRKFGSASRKDIDALLWDKLSDALDDKQKRNKIGNLLSNLRAKGVIFNAASKTSPKWELQE